MLGILILQAIKEHRALKSSLVAGSNISVLIGDIQQDLPNRPSLLLGESRQFFNDL
jgi:hypothetical protein